ncbi:MAG: dTMP kinase [Solirubrobacteraceae bacterium]
MLPVGRLITIEGIDGTGKTTLAAGLQTALRARGVDVTLLREPGGVGVSERLRTLVKDPELTIGARCEALLYAAARAQLVEEAITPRLQDGVWVLLDRFVDSSLAYQGGGRRLGIEQIAALNEFATAGRRADRTLLLMLEAAAARARARARADGSRTTSAGAGLGDASSAEAATVDRLEREADEFFERVQDAYASLAAREPDRIRVIDASRAPAQVLADALAALADLCD